MGAFWSQLLPAQPAFKEEHIPSLDGKVFIVTGGNAGVGLALVKMLYAKGGCTIYIASRSTERIDAAIQEIKSSLPAPSKPTQLKALRLNLNDLSTIQESANQFLAQESRLDILWNNAGIAQAPIGQVTKQGYEAHMGVNCLGPFLFTKLLTPLITKTAQASPAGSVRVIWTSSQIIDTGGPKGGVDLEEQKPGKHPADKNHTYSASKAGNWFLASELDKRTRQYGVISITQNPGNLSTKIWGPVPFVMKSIMSIFLYDARYGAYTELWSGLSPDITTADGGKYAVPWGGSWHPAPREDILVSLKSKEDGGSGFATTFWNWCDENTKQYAS